MATASDQTWRENLNCPLCLEVFRDPKLLDCAHTFCKSCLDRLHKAQPGGDSMPIKCPVCRQVTPASQGNVDQLKTNLIVKSLIADIKKRGQACTACSSDEKADAAFFCADCGDFLCESCQDAHSKLARFSGHALVAALDPSVSKMLTKKRRKCHNHPTEDEECFCTACCKYVCFKCVFHEHSKHEVVQAIIHEDKLKKEAREISAKTATRDKKLEKFIGCVIDHRQRLSTMRKELKDDARKTVQAAIKKLSNRLKELEGNIDKLINDLDEKLQCMEADSSGKKAQANTLNGMIMHSAKAPLQLDALEAHRTVRCDLNELLSCPDPDESQLKITVGAAEALSFYSDEGLDKLEVGSLACWNLVAETALPVKDSMDAMASAPDGFVVVGCSTGGMGLYKFNPNGVLQVCDLATVQVRDIKIMKNGRLVVLDTSNKITSYSPMGNISSYIYETLGFDEGGVSEIAIDIDNEIYCSYNKAQKILVFDLAGGKPVREIPCQEYEPMQTFAMNSRKMLVIKNGQYQVCTIDSSSGAVVDAITQANMHAHPAVCQDDSILIAWVNHEEGLVSIDHYTGELGRIRNLVTNHKITKPEKRPWYYLQQFSRGEIAFCTPDILYIFCKKIQRFVS